MVTSRSKGSVGRRLRAGSGAGIRRGLAALAVLCALAAGLMTRPAWAAAPGAPVAAAPAKADETPSRAELQRLIDTLQDDKARGQLVTQLRALIAAQERAAGPRPGLGARLMAGLSERMEMIGTGFIQVGEQLSRPDVFLTWLEQQARSPAKRLFWARVFATLAGVFGAAAVTYWIVQRLLQRARGALADRPYDTVWTRFGAVLVRALFELVPILAFAAAGYGVLTLTGPSHNVRMVALAVLDAAIIVRLLVALARLTFSPLAANLRLLPLADETAAYAFVWARRFIIVAVYGYFAGQLSLLLRLSAAGHAAVIKLIALLVVIMIVILLLQVRPRVTELLRGPAPAQRRRGLERLRVYLAEAWHILAIVLIFAAYFGWALAIRGGFAFVLRGVIGTIAIIGAARLLVVLEQRLLRQLFSISADFRQRYPTLEERASRYVPLIRGLLTGIIAVIASVFILQVWGVNALHALHSGGGRGLVLGAARIVFIVVLAMAVIEGAGLAIARYLHSPAGNGAIRERSARARTLLPLMRNVIVLLVGSIAAISVLSQLGLDVAPLIAGVGIFGLAVGFGAQSLVKDVITGAFILFEDTIAVGDVVNLGSHSGTVEALSIRSVRLRDVSGHVHTVPFGAIEAVTNRTRGFAFHVADIGIGYNEDIDAVGALLVEVVEQMRREPAYAGAILAPLEVMGIERFAESAVMLRARIRTHPLEQWRIGREFNRRVKKAFDEHGIEIPFPHRTVFFGVDRDGTAPPARLVVEATRAKAPGRGPESAPTRSPDPEAPGPEPDNGADG